MAGMEKYWEPGILEEYCLGLLPGDEAAAITKAAKASPELLQQIQAIENSLMQYSQTELPADLRQKVLGGLDNMATAAKIDISNPPLISRNSDLEAWNEAVNGLLPNADFGAIKVHFLRETEDLQLCVAWLYNELDETEHHADEFAESFFILEGSCECNIGGQLIRLQAGDYLDIPFDTHHTIKATTPETGFVKAILQRKKLAA